MFETMKSSSHLPLRVLLFVLLLAACTAGASAGERQELTINGRPGFILRPAEEFRVDGPAPWVWYAPTLGARHPSVDEQWMVERLHAAGIALAGVDVGESFGSPAGREVYQAFYEELTQKRGFHPQPVLLARSRGGLMLYSWAVEHPDCVGGIAGIYPVCNVASYPGVKRAAPAYELTPKQLAETLDQYNPVDRLQPLARARVPIYHLQGDDDRVVPHEENSLLLAQRYRALGGPIEIELIPGQGHNMWRGWFESQRLVNFIIARALGQSPLRLGTPFLDNAILQCNMPIPIWGWAFPGADVTVSFGSQTLSTVADEDGKWRVDLEPEEPSRQARQLTASSGDESIRLQGILVGEVWFASGQSNMDWLANKSNCRDLAGQLARSTKATPIRELNLDIGSSVFPRETATAEAGWKSSRQAGSFSALALAFAHEIYRELDVPVGIVRSSHGATPIETWIAYEGLASHPALQDIALRVRQSDPTTKDGQQAYSEYYAALRAWQEESERLLNLGGSSLPRPKLPGIADDWKGPTRMFNRKIAPLIPYVIRGAIWCQGESNSNDGKIYAAKMEALVNGWREHWGRPNLPFYFTQMQCYGQPDVDEVGFADLREAQMLFFRQAEHVGMAAQHDLNPARPTGIHPFNKSDPGTRLARWALAHEYGRKIAYAGPLYKSHRIVDDIVRVQFEQRGPGDGLMVGSKGREENAGKGPDAFVEPATETPGEPLRHFRLAGRDKVWHDAVAAIEGNEVVVRSDAVPAPVGVQYAYSRSPIGANLYNEAGLPAYPFAYFGGRQMFNEDDPEIVAAAKAEAERRWGKRSYLLPATLFRDNAVLQRGIPAPVWGHGVPGVTVNVSFAGQRHVTKVDRFERWRVDLDPLPPTKKGRDLVIHCSNGESATIRNVLVGDVWFLTGSRQLDRELLRPTDAKSAEAPAALPLVREFRIKTKARRFRTPRKRRMEIGGGKYVASWQPADFDDQGDPPSVIAYYFAKAARAENVPLGIVTLGAENPPLTWVSPEAMQTAVGFEEERDNLNLGYPNTEVCKRAVAEYIHTLQLYNQKVAGVLGAGKALPASLADAAPAFPEPFYDQWASRTETATHTYNFCISPLTPFAVRGVAWIPGKNNMEDDGDRYAASLQIYAKSLPKTFGQQSVSFLFAHPTQQLVEDMPPINISGPEGVSFDEWPQRLDDLGQRIGALARESTWNERKP